MIFVTTLKGNTISVSWNAEKKALMVTGKDGNSKELTDLRSDRISAGHLDRITFHLRPEDVARIKELLFEYVPHPEPVDIVDPLIISTTSGPAVLRADSLNVYLLLRNGPEPKDWFSGGRRWSGDWRLETVDKGGILYWWDSRMEPNVPWKYRND